MNIVPFQLARERAGGTLETLQAPRSLTPSQDVLIGIAIIALVPALFWTAMAWIASQVFAFDVSLAGLGVMAASIAAFLTIVCSAIVAAN